MLSRLDQEQSILSDSNLTQCKGMRQSLKSSELAWKQTLQNGRKGKK